MLPPLSLFLRLEMGILAGQTLELGERMTGRCSFPLTAITRTVTMVRTESQSLSELRLGQPVNRSKSRVDSVSR